MGWRGRSRKKVTCVCHDTAWLQLWLHPGTGSIMAPTLAGSYTLAPIYICNGASIYGAYRIGAITGSYTMAPSWLLHWLAPYIGSTHMLAPGSLHGSWLHHGSISCSYSLVKSWLHPNQSFMLHLYIFIYRWSPSIYI